MGDDREKLTDQMFTIAIGKQLLEAIEEIAVKELTSVADIVRRAVREYIAKFRKANDDAEQRSAQ